MQVEPVLCATLSPVLQSQEVPVVGLELASDLRKLSKSYPAVAAFQRVPCTLDLRSLWEVYAERTGVEARGNGNRKGLSGLSEAVLGKPMDKAMQVRLPLDRAALPVVAEGACTCKPRGALGLVLR